MTGIRIKCENCGHIGKPKNMTTIEKGNQIRTGMLNSELKMGRPIVRPDISTINSLRSEGLNMTAIAAILEVGRSTLYRVLREN